MILAVSFGNTLTFSKNIPFYVQKQDTNNITSANHASVDNCSATKNAATTKESCQYFFPKSQSTSTKIITKFFV